MKFHLNPFRKQKSELTQPIYSVYQPIVDIATWDVVGYEALVRSENETPVEMFRRSYEKGTVVSFDFHCLMEAVKVLPKFQAGQFLFLNIEPMTLEKAFEKGKMGEEFLKSLTEYSGQIVFELTEGIKKSDFDYIKKGVDFIRTLGYRFALDDLSEIGSKTFQLASLRPDFFKVDLQLIQGIANNHTNQRIVREMVHLGRMSGSEMIAEGVEQLVDYKFIRTLGIRYGQGFYFAKPSRELITFLQPPQESAI